MIQRNGLTLVGCNGAMDLNTRAVTSPGYPLNYTPRRLTCTWYIDERPNSRINFSFPNPISAYQYDTVTVKLEC